MADICIGGVESSGSAAVLLGCNEEYLSRFIIIIIQQ
jgi:hypothetical protein